jgi:hypothetical protein
MWGGCDGLEERPTCLLRSNDHLKDVPSVYRSGNGGVNVSTFGVTGKLSSISSVSSIFDVFCGGGDACVVDVKSSYVAATLLLIVELLVIWRGGFGVTMRALRVRFVGRYC